MSLNHIVDVPALSEALTHALEHFDSEGQRARAAPALRAEAQDMLTFLVNGLAKPSWSYATEWLTVLAFATGAEQSSSADVTLMRRAVQKRQCLGVAFNQGTLIAALRVCSSLQPADDLIDRYVVREELRLHEMRRRLFELLGQGDEKRLIQVVKWSDKVIASEVNNIAGI